MQRSWVYIELLIIDLNLCCTLTTGQPAVFKVFKARTGAYLIHKCLMFREVAKLHRALKVYVRPLLYT
jgi:hypothetical protein